MQGHRVDRIDQVSEPGDYCVIVDGNGEPRSLWCAMPDARVTIGRCAAIGYGFNEEPEWRITIEDDDTVTVEPSIDASNGGQLPDRYHGHLTKGVWSP